MTGSLDTLVTAIRACRVCRDAPHHQPALGHEPRPVIQAGAGARLVIAGQAPGTRVHASGKPFTDPSGDRLRQWLGVSDEEFYDASKIALVPMGFCFPGLDAKGGDLPPRKECMALWHDRLYAAMPRVELVVAMGMYAHRYHLDQDGFCLNQAKIMNLIDSNKSERDASGKPVPTFPHPALSGKRKKTLTGTIMTWRDIYDAGAKRRYLPLPHPSWRNNAWLKKNPWFEAELLPVLRAEVERLVRGD